MQIYLHITFNDLYIRRLTFVYIPKSIYIIHKYTLYIFVVIFPQQALNTFYM